MPLRPAVIAPPVPAAASSLVAAVVGFEPAETGTVKLMSTCTAGFDVVAGCESVIPTCFSATYSGDWELSKLVAMLEATAAARTPAPAAAPIDTVNRSVVMPPAAGCCRRRRRLPPEGACVGSCKSMLVADTLRDEATPAASAVREAGVEKSATDTPARARLEATLTSVTAALGCEPAMSAGTLSATAFVNAVVLAPRRLRSMLMIESEKDTDERGGGRGGGGGGDGGVFGGLWSGFGSGGGELRSGGEEKGGAATGVKTTAAGADGGGEAAAAAGGAGTEAAGGLPAGAGTTARGGTSRGGGCGEGRGGG